MNMPLHQFACCVVFYLVYFLRGFFYYYFSLLLLDLIYFLFSLLLLLFEGINCCFVSYSFVSVKGPGRKLSLPTDLKTDLGTVGESQQLPLDFLSVINFLPLSHFRGFFNSQTFFFRFPCHSILPPNSPQALFFNLLTHSVIDCVFMFPLHFASVYEGDLLMHILKPEVLSHLTTIGPFSEFHDLSSIDRLALVIGSLAAPMILTRPISLTVFSSFLKEPSVFQTMRVLPCISNCRAYTS